MGEGLFSDYPSGPREQKYTEYDKVFTKKKHAALAAIEESMGINLNTRQRVEIDTILQELVGFTIVKSGGAFVPWREKAK